MVHNLTDNLMVYCMDERYRTNHSWVSHGVGYMWFLDGTAPRRGRESLQELCYPCPYGSKNATRSPLPLYRSSSPLGVSCRTRPSIFVFLQQRSATTTVRGLVDCMNSRPQTFLIYRRYMTFSTFKPAPIYIKVAP